jgi:hypothetical protein
MMTVLYTEGTIGDACTYTNERQLGRPILPERFESTSFPALAGAATVELGFGDQYSLPIVSETPVFHVLPDERS